ncbi:MAG: carboxypeptidase M32 [Planctomycetes bacterium]|nr:carboxypeptidase M32 [Planctomycetota bacterium]
MSEPYDALIARAREAHLLESTAEILAWDQETMMPPGGVDHRARQLGLLARLAHERRTAPEIAELLARCDAADLPDEAKADVRELRRSFDRSASVPAELVQERSEVTSRAQHAWARAREDSDFASFRPWLERVLSLERNRAACLGVPDGGELWDALAEDYEPGMRAADLAPLFAPLRERLGAFVQELSEVHGPSNRCNEIEFEIDRQEKFVRRIATAIGFDFSRGRIDRSAHPFCGGSHAGDVRITTRFHRDNVGDALGSTMHECGHGIYEQGLPADRVGTPLGTAVSLGIHESQSRLWENHVGRSAGFWRWCADVATEELGSAAAMLSADDWFGSSNVVRPSLIRVEADEATYNLHVVVRFDLERRLVSGDLEVADLPDAWNAAYREVLGVDVPDDRDGCLQDVHWSCGLVGYFPTYTLGTLYAAQFFAAAERDLGDLEEPFACGDFAPLRDWLRQNVHCHGMRYGAEELCRRATGAGLDAEIFLNYLERKLRPLYGVD